MCEDGRADSSRSFDVVTGAFGYTGKYIARRLLKDGRRVRTLTSRVSRDGLFDGQIDVVPFNFDDSEKLTASMLGASTLYNTYWIRFPYGDITFDTAVTNTKALFNAAARAGVSRIVHVSITNPSLESPLGYFRGKAELESALGEMGVSHAIVRPTVVFGKEDILVNNIAWFLRKFPVFVIPGGGNYRLQPIYVEDLADLAVELGRGSEDVIIDAVGPETYSFNEFVRLIADAIGARIRLVHLPTALAVAASRCIGWFLRDVPLTKDEAEGLMSNLLISDRPATGATHFSEWVNANAGTLGDRYSSELARHYR